MILATTSVYGRTKVIVRQDMDFVKVFAGKDTKYMIKEDINLGGKKVTIGAGSTLCFKGGSLANGTVVGNNTKVNARNYEIFKRGYVRYRAYFAAKTSKHPSVQKEYHDCIVLAGTWCNKRCGSKWTGLLNESNEDVMLAVRNYIILYPDGASVTLPKINALGYESTAFPGNRAIDFRNSTISYPDDLSVWEDITINLPTGSTPATMESGYGLISVGSNTAIKNLSIDGKSTKRQGEAVRLGVSCIISIGSSKNVTLENVSLSNVLGPGVTAQAGAENLTFKGCKFFNIGEHIMYSHQYKGYCHFEGCIFDTWDSERISVHRNGLDYLYKHTPPVDSDVSYDDLYAFDLSFDNCMFNNPKRINSQGRTLGGFLTGNFPHVVNINNSTFTGAQPPFNPGGGSAISDKSGKCFKMIVRGCDGAPYVYSSNSNYNIVTEFYDCVNIPFRIAYTKRYENCQLFIDLNESTNENVSPVFEEEFSEPLLVKGCTITDRGNTGKINHPLLHRPIIFEGCFFSSTVKRDYVPEIVNVKSEKPVQVTFNKCKFDLEGFRLVGGKLNQETLSINSCRFENILDKEMYQSKNQ